MKLKACALGLSLFIFLGSKAGGECIKGESIENPKLEHFFSLPNSAFSEALKQLLEISVKSAVEKIKLGEFDNNINIHLDPPGSFINVKQIGDVTGYSTEINKLESSLNRAAALTAEKLLPGLLEEIRRLKFRDPDEVVVDSDSAATECLRQKKKEKLLKLAKPYAAEAIRASGAIVYCERIKANPFPSRFVKDESCDFSDYISEKTVEGIFTLMSLEEKDIRHNPKRWNTKILKEIIGTAHYFDF